MRDMAIELSLVHDLPLFRHLSSRTLAQLLTRATLARVPRGSVIFEQGTTATSFYLLLEGRLKVIQVTKDGQQVMVRVVHPGDLFGFAQALARPDYPGTARAAVDSVVVCWPMSDWDAVIETNPRLAINTVQTIGQRLDEAHTRLRELSTQQVERRVAHAILRLAEKAGRVQRDCGIMIDFPITRQDIAEMTGTTLHTVSRLMSAWEGQGLVKGGRQKLTVLDVERLRRVADPET